MISISRDTMTAVESFDLEGNSLVTSFEDLVAINGAPTTDVSGIKMSVPALTSGMSDVALVHYSTARSTWEVITPDSVDLENKEVTASFKDLSPVAVIAKMDAQNNLTEVVEMKNFVLS